MITVNVFEGKEELITAKEFTQLSDALAWVLKMGIAGVYYKING